MAKIVYALGTYLESGDMRGNIGGRALCPDGKVRKLKRIAASADTFFSVPAAVEVKRNGRHYTVAGFVSCSTLAGFDTATDDDPAVLKFTPYQYRKNHAAFGLDTVGFHPCSSCETPKKCAGQEMCDIGEVSAEEEAASHPA